MASVDGPDPEGLDEQVASLRARYADCDLCAHECHVDRTAGETGVCGIDDRAYVGTVGPHHGEEPPLSGIAGSGTIFFGYCNLGCVFCQNWELSRAGRGTAPRSAREIADHALGLQARGCHNVNFVTPTHVSPTIAEAIVLARGDGLTIPTVWNCGGYENPAVVRDLEGLVDVYLPDIKWSDDAAAQKYSMARGYWAAAKASVAEMHRQVGTLELDDEGIATGGLLVRHLVMPGYVENAMRIVDFLVDELTPKTTLTLMSQYRPAHRVPLEERYGAIDRRITSDEYRRVVTYARNRGMTNLVIDEYAL